jgi:dipeptidyl aminopeptidase/acylaminoacyl peptidase
MRTTRRLLIASVAAALSLIVAMPAQAVFPGYNGKRISSEPRYDWENCELEEGGHCDAPPRMPSMIVLGVGDNASDLVEGTEPTFSPDAKTIAYVANDTIWTINRDGSDETERSLRDDDEADSRPAWSPNAERIAFQRRTSEGSSIYWMYASSDTTSGGVVTRVGKGRRPEWSSTGRLAYIRRSDGARWVYLNTANGKNLRRVRGTRRASDVTWGPAGRKLAFIRPGKGENECLVTIVPGNRDSRRVLRCGLDGEDGGDVNGLTFAPNGRSIVVAVQDDISEPTHIAATNYRIYLGAGSKKVPGGLQPDWGVRQ